MTQLVEVLAGLLSPCLVAPILSVSSSQRLKPQVVVGRDSNLEISGTLASRHRSCAPPPPPNASFCWLAAAGGTKVGPVWRQHKAPACCAVKVGRSGGGLVVWWWWSKLVAKCRHTPSPFAHRTARPTVNMPPMPKLPNAARTKYLKRSDFRRTKSLSHANKPSFAQG